MNDTGAVYIRGALVNVFPIIKSELLSAVTAFNIRKLHQYIHSISKVSVDSKIHQSKDSSYSEDH